VAVSAADAGTVEPSSPPPDRLLGNAGALLLGRLAVAAFGWGGTVLIVRRLTPEEFGRFALLFSILGMLSIVTDMGIGRVAVAGVLDRADQAGRFVGSYVVLRSLLGLVGYVIAVGFVSLERYPTDVIEAMAVAALVVVLATPSHAFEIVFQTRLRLRSVALAGVAGQAAQFALTAAIATGGGSVMAFVVPAVVSEALYLSVLSYRAHRLMPIRYRVDVAQWRALLREALPLSLGTAFATLTYRIDSVMLSQLDTFRAVGHYNVASKFPDLVRFGSTAVATPMMTILVASFPDRADAFRSALRRASGALALFGAAAIVGFSLFATDAVALFYGDEHAEAGTATVILVVAQVTAFATSMAFTVLAATGRHRVYPYVAAVGLATNVVLNLFVIPHWSYEGAATTTLVTEVIVLVPLLVLVGRVPHVRPFPWPALGRLAGAGAVASAVGFALDTARVPWGLGAAVVLVVFVATARLIGAFSLEELRGRR
jgi:O-antigen/teichoic acid export membrane protein